MFKDIFKSFFPWILFFILTCQVPQHLGIAIIAVGIFCEFIILLLMGCVMKFYLMLQVWWG